MAATTPRDDTKRAWIPPITSAVQTSAEVTAYSGADTDLNTPIR